MNLTPRTKRLIIYLLGACALFMLHMVMSKNAETSGFIMGYAEGVDDAMKVLPFIDHENRADGGPPMSIRELAEATRHRLND